jgi:hypothetical protein
MVALVKTRRSAPRNAALQRDFLGALRAIFSAATAL